MNQYKTLRKLQLVQSMRIEANPVTNQKSCENLEKRCNIYSKTMLPAVKIGKRSKVFDQYDTYQ